MNKSFGVAARVKAPEGYKGLWVNIYKRGNMLIPGGGYEKRKQADTIAKSYRYDCVYVHVKVK